MPADRTDFLLKMYDQMFNDINTHILVVWQSVAVVVGAFAVFALVEKAVISPDVAAALIVLLCGWLLAHLYDASYWYNRNLVIIANIERQFLSLADLKNIHYYFGKHRAKSAMLTHLKIQYALGTAVGTLFLIFHFYTRVLPGLGSPWANFEPLRTLPYLVLIGCVIRLGLLRKNRLSAYEEFMRNSPGIDVSTIGIVYGVGHPAYGEAPNTPPTPKPEERKPGTKEAGP
jgi:hypothetical protein